jgi:hypothetical protein
VGWRETGRTKRRRRATPGVFFHYVFVKNTNKKSLSHIHAGRGTMKDRTHERRRTEGIGEDLAE